MGGGVQWSKSSVLSAKMGVKAKHFCHSFFRKMQFTTMMFTHGAFLSSFRGLYYPQVTCIRLIQELIRHAYFGP